MQWGIIKNIKQIWETLHQELKGPKINNLYKEERKIKINNQEIEDKRKIILHNGSIKCEITNLNDNLKINVNEMTMKGEILNSNLLKDKFNFKNRAMLIKKNKEVEIKKIKILLKKVSINELELEKKGKKEKIGTKNINLEIKSKIKTDLAKINKIPKKIKGEKIYFYSKAELLMLLRKLKLSKPDLNMKNYTIKSFFLKVPLENISNLKYYPKENILAMYYNNNKLSKKEADFIVLKNKFSEMEKKIFI
ncbi:MAG: hypothetical protein B6I28_00250 [Fusobacteriia bacterium 4572_132]|nr:MAG: hypothetical protein B6I28_00250 [Fusobacteriia bacterium 4572_132]